MASQPANASIRVHRRVRSQRDLKLHRSAFETFQRINPQVMMVPGEEVLVTETRDASTSVLDTSLTIGRSSGLPIVRYTTARPSLEAAAEGITGLHFPVRIGQDAFLEKDNTNVADDLHGDLRAV